MFGALNSRIYSFDINLMYGLKCQLKDRPMPLLCFALILLIMIFCVAIKVIEFQVYR